ncbi:hypothetical protein [Clostridium chauvoei]|uniref:Uncharacterized protein n=3 Tax=Clostridium chauvoei TaxID=46867 RepID=S6EZH9_9CLOT|nr:hypothetical protein [Clostridium chauvoei]ATD55089.1 hypothetical protein BTM20_07495 [Clostridium chauvoei]ATD57237.1 hypothetical protein BTM21_05560 [Clostridium chauvoei]MBX7279433.1 hypothetical protein [Clostridium chauvoei]MBX7282481.1 hypothetical protein [Clostridium chauvoei]MBX7285632.1 hypothetical protein [Clostridium chauvoei]
MNALKIKANIETTEDFSPDIFEEAFKISFFNTGYKLYSLNIIKISEVTYDVIYYVEVTENMNFVFAVEALNNTINQYDTFKVNNVDKLQLVEFNN